MLVVTSNMFLRGEYIYKRLYKKRNDEALFENQLGGVWSWTTLASWQAGNPIRTSKFQGAYVEMGYLLCGKDTVMTTSTDCCGEVTREEIWRLWPVTVTRI